MSASMLKVRLSRQAGIESIPLNVSMACQAGQMLALSGPSGSGKTTVLRAICGLHRVPDGQVLCGDKVWQDSHGGIFLPARHRRIGMVFQNYALFPHMRALQNVLSSTPGKRKSDRRATALAWLKRVNLSGLEERLPSQLSGGQQQRVALARALAREPDVLLLDEPFAAVDQQTRQRLYSQLAQLRSELHMPIVLVTHDLNEVMQLADTISVIHHGNTLQSGVLGDVLSRPKTVETARLLGHQNLYSARTMASENPFLTEIEAFGQRLRVDHRSSSGELSKARRSAGENITLMVPASGIVLHRRDRPSRGERENPVNGVVKDYVVLGDEVLLRVQVRADEPTLSFKVSRHVATRNGVAKGESVGLSLIANSLHLIDGANKAQT